MASRVIRQVIRLTWFKSTNRGNPEDARSYLSCGHDQLEARGERVRLWSFMLKNGIRVNRKCYECSSQEDSRRRRR